MKSVLFSINKPHTDHIRSLRKKVELRTKPPKIDGAYKGFIYETKKFGGSGKVIGEFTAYNESTCRVCIGGNLAHLAVKSQVPWGDILKYSDYGKKDITAISISNLKIYDEPKELSEFIKPCPTPFQCDKCNDLVEHFGCGLTITIPPQSWCYVEEKEQSECTN